MTEPEQPAPLALTRHECIEAIVAMDVLLAITRASSWPAFAEERKNAVMTVEGLRAKIRSQLR
jgi:hypothetical protein